MPRQSTDGPTPAGGVRSEMTLYAADGTETDDPAAAVRGVITEYDGRDEPIARTHFDPRAE